MNNNTVILMVALLTGYAIVAGVFFQLNLHSANLDGGELFAPATSSIIVPVIYTTHHGTVFTFEKEMARLYGNP